MLNSRRSGIIAKKRDEVVSLYRFKEFLDSLEHYELVKIKQDLDKGSIDLGKSIQNKINELERRHSKFCVTCSNNLDPYNSSSFTLLFGPEDFKKKASFCGSDCLVYFLTKLKQVQKGDRHADKIE